MIIIGIDPDSSKHGVAEYHNGVLVRLTSLDLMSIYINLENTLINIEARGGEEKLEVHIEDVCANNAIFIKRQAFKSKKEYEGALKARARKVGMVQQSQIELERVCEFLGVKVVKHKISSNWKDTKHGKKQFEMVTGWNNRSNEDTRSAAYFGFLGHKNGITKIN